MSQPVIDRAELRIPARIGQAEVAQVASSRVVYESDLISGTGVS
ncbi:hypothetical protein [Mycolicibacterium vinylchloridicum]|nr:hypothetical protein [Mycolicibacterium vinylchloridicum]